MERFRRRVTLTSCHASSRATTVIAIDAMVATEVLDEVPELAAPLG
jgi:hypothetical protein